MRFTQKFVFFVFLVFGPVSQAEVYDVSTTAELREALASAAEAGGDNTIRLAAGTYSTQDDGEGKFEYISGSEGSISIVAQNKSQKPVLDGAGADQILMLFGPDNALSLEIDSLKFENAGDGAVVIRSTQMHNVDVRNSEFKNNIRELGGGAIHLRGVRTGAIAESIFEGNKATRRPAGADGGAVELEYIIMTFEISGSTFIDNDAERKGGAIFLGDSVGLTIQNSHFEGNSANSGAAVYGSANITNSSFDGNNPVGSGAVVANASLIAGNTFTNHSRTLIYRDQGGVVANNLFISNDNATVQSARVNNNLFQGTSVTVKEGYIVANNVFLGNDSGISGKFDEPYFLTVHNNYINPSAIDSNAILEGDGNIFDGVNLGFVNAEEGDYRLSSSSDLIDAGTTDPELAYITDYDYTGTTARVIGASIDIGPYEYDGEAPADSDGDGINDNIDNCPSIANDDQADFDSDGEGDVCDSDDDNDGTNDEDDAFPFDDTESLDTDGDGIGNNEDEDDDGDGFLDASDPQPIIANVFAIDSDGDGVADSIDDYPTDATKQFSSDGDFDGDGFTNEEEVDYCTNPFDKNSQPDVGGLSVWMLYLGTQQEDTQ